MALIIFHFLPAPSEEEEEVTVGMGEDEEEDFYKVYGKFSSTSFSSPPSRTG